MIDDDDYTAAIDRLHIELRNDPGYPDILSLLGYSYGRTSNHQNIVNFIGWRCRRNCNIKANQFLVEYYLQVDQLEKARQQLELLESWGLFSSREYAQLKKSIEQYQQQTGKL